MSSAITQKSKATRSAAGGAGGLFSCLDFYSRFEGLTEVHARMVGAGATLNKAVKSALRETVMGPDTDSCDALLADVITEPDLRASVFTKIPDNSLKDAQRAVAKYVERLVDRKVAEVGSSIDKVLKQDIQVGLLKRCVRASPRPK